MKLGQGFAYLLYVAASAFVLIYLGYGDDGIQRLSAGWRMSFAGMIFVGLVVATGAFIVILKVPCSAKLLRACAIACAVAVGVSIGAFVCALFMVTGSNQWIALMLWSLPGFLTFLMQFARLTDRDIPRNLRERMWAQQDSG